MEREIANKIVIMEGELAKREERMAAMEGELSSRIKQLEVILNTCYRWAGLTSILNIQEELRSRHHEIGSARGELQLEGVDQVSENVCLLLRVDKGMH